MLDLPILSFITFLPTVGALLIYVMAPYFKKDEDSVARMIALSVSMIVFILSILVWIQYRESQGGIQFLEKSPWIEGYDIFYAMGLDGLSVLFIVLTGFITPICIISSWHSIDKKVKEYMMAFLVMETFIMGTFCALDLFLFYVFFEAVLIPMYLIIGIWGGNNRVYAAYKFFLYTLAGSIFLLVGIVYIYFQAETTYIPDLNNIIPTYAFDIQSWLWLAFFASFAVKVPMWPVHTWLPDAHVQAPTAGSVVLAGVLLKLGGYGFLRFSLPLFPAASEYFANFVFWLSIIAIVYTSLIALMQEDMKKLIAYSSIAHMGFVTAGIFTFNQQGIEGAIFQMISHGVISGALFLCVGVLYDRMHTKEIAFYGGLTKKMPKFALQFMVFTLASVGLPSTSGFVGEIMIIISVFPVSKLFCALIATGVILGAAYMLWLYARVMYGEIKNSKLNKIEDINIVEKLSFWPLTVAIFVLGIYPNLILADMHKTVIALIEDFNENKSAYSKVVSIDEFDKEFEIKVDDL